MKPQLHKLPINDTSFLFKKWDCDYFDKSWHFHEEYELVLIDKSRGTKFIGDKVGYFREGDVIFMGSNIPHLFRNSEEYYSQDMKLEASSLFIHFKEDFLGKDFFDKPEMKLVRKLLDNSSLALELQGKIKRYVAGKLHAMYYENPPQRLLSLLDILIRLSESSELHPLLSNEFAANRTSQSANIKDTNRIHKVFEFISSNYKKQIYLQEIASLLNMSPASFSRYFKHHTRKTFSDYVTEVRISHACRLLMQDDESISNICYESGFENLSNFYKHFRRITGALPKDYRKRFLKTEMPFQNSGI